MTSPLEIRAEGRVLHLVLNGDHNGNLLNRALLTALEKGLDEIDQVEDFRLLTLSATGPVFCDGMDFQEAMGTHGTAQDELPQMVRKFYALLERLTRLPVLVAALIDGRVNAGGMGLMAACDLVYATPRSDFGLSEVLFGLVPATITPFLLRRTGFHATYRMALTGLRLTADQAKSCGLVDEIHTDPSDVIRRLRLRAERLDRRAVSQIKHFFADQSNIGEASCLRAEKTLVALFDAAAASESNPFIRLRDQHR